VAPAFTASLAQRQVIDSVPEHQQAKLEKAFEPNTVRDPHPPIEKRAEPMSPEKNSVIPDLSKYGVLTRIPRPRAF
jgi:hypothetical protein